MYFITNDLLQTPSQPILHFNEDEEREEAVGCVRGLGKVDRWTGEEHLNRTGMDVPVFIVAYNKYMNSVDRMDQKRSTNPTKRKEKRLGMSIFTYLLDLSVLQSFAIFKTIRPYDKATLTEFKRDLCDSLIYDLRERKALRKVERSEVMKIDNVLGINDCQHMLVENLNKKDINCHLCLYMKKKKKTIYGCVQCRKGFHVNCFTAYHCTGALKGNTKALMCMVLQSERN